MNYVFSCFFPLKLPIKDLIPKQQLQGTIPWDDHPGNPSQLDPGLERPIRSYQLLGFTTSARERLGHNSGRSFWGKILCQTGVKRREFSGMIHWLTINNHPSNPQQPIHSLRKTHQ
jgi:hypothetical protein